MLFAVPAIHQDKAIELLTSPGSSLAAKFGRKPTAPTRTELLFLPYYCFDVELSGSGNGQTVRVAVDGLSGDAVFFITRELEFTSLEDQQSCDFEISAHDAQEIAADQYKRMLLEHGLRNKTATTVHGISDADRTLYPFWVGFFRKGNTYDFKALDAVSGEVQGVRMRKVFLKAFRQLDNR